MTCHTQAKRIHAEEAAAASQDLCRSLREQLVASKLSDEQAQLALATLKASMADVKETQSGMQQASSRELQGLQEALQVRVVILNTPHDISSPPNFDWVIAKKAVWGSLGRVDKGTR